MNEPNLTPIAADGRYGLAHSGRRYTIIGVDAYRPPYIPWHLTTQEFFQIVFDHLEDEGALVINVGRSPSDRSLINDLATTIGSVFPSVYVMDVPGTFNSIIYATRQPTGIANLYRNYAVLTEQATLHPLLKESLSRAILYLQPTPPPSRVYTDDLAPIEWVTNKMVLSYVLSGQAAELK